MSYVVINAIHVPAGQGPELEARFAARKHSVDGEPGFESFQLLRPVSGDERYFVMTTWSTQEAFTAWRDGKAKAAHGQADGADRKPVATGADLLEFETVEL